MAVSRIKNKRVYLSICQSLSSVEHIVCYADSSGAEQSVLRVARGVGIFKAFFNILNCYKACELSVFINKRKLLNL